MTNWEAKIKKLLAKAKALTKLEEIHLDADFDKGVVFLNFIIADKVIDELDMESNIMKLEPEAYDAVMKISEFVQKNSLKIWNDINHLEDGYGVTAS